MPTDLASARFYAILDTGYVAPDNWSTVCAGLIAGGADLIQIRAKDKTPREREDLLAEILPLFDPADPASPHLIINDDVDLCARHPGTGLHLGQDDLPPAQARDRIGPDRVIGLSTHSLAQATAAMRLPSGCIDYFAVGPVFATQTKPDYPPVSLTLVREVARLRPPIPWFCIGGVNRKNLSVVLASGARRVVAVSDVLQAAEPAAAVRDFRTALTT